MTRDLLISSNTRLLVGRFGVRRWEKDTSKKKHRLTGVRPAGYKRVSRLFPEGKAVVA
jgi:hypothetical protein